MYLLFLCLAFILAACGSEDMAKQPSLDESNVTKTSDVVDRITASIQHAQEKENLNAFIFLNEEGALNAAQHADEISAVGGSQGVLHGIPFVVKDNIHVAGMTNTAGTRGLSNFIPDTSNAVVQALENAGAIMLGKTNMHELAFGITSNNAAYGAVHNARNPELIPGGSSGGTAVAIATGVVTMGLGTDTGGSTRIPAALNGIAGFRPSLGRYNTQKVTPVSSTRDTVGPLARSVKLISLMDSVITSNQCATNSANLQGLRLGVPREYFYQNLSTEVAQNINSMLAKLTQAGVELVEVELPDLEQANAGISFPVALHEVINELPEYLKENHIDLTVEQLIGAVASPDVKGALGSQLGPDAIPDEVYKQAIEHFRPMLQSIYANAFENYNVSAMVMPTTPLLATPIATSDETVELNGEQVPTFGAFIHNTDPSSNAGLPSLVIPSGANSHGNPFSVMLDGPINDDCRLLQIGLAVDALFNEVI